MIGSVRIVGAGLIGTSIGLALKSSSVAVEMVDTDAHAQRISNDLVKGAPITNPDLIVIAVPLSQNESVVLEQLNSNPTSIVCDIASVKSDLLLKVEKLSDNAANFVSLHPMAGREIAGAEGARADLFQGRAWVAIKSAQSSSDALSIADQLIKICGATAYWLTPQEHDLVEILIQNRSAIKPALSQIIDQLTELNKSLDNANKDDLFKFLNSGVNGKNRIPGKHGARERNYSYLPIVIDDKPGELARIFNECAKAAVNVEDLSIEHSPGQETGLITLALSESDCKKLANHMNKQGFKVHPAKNR